MRTMPSLLVCVLTCCLIGCGGSRSSHHSITHLELFDGARDAARASVEFEKVVKIVDAWAAEAGLSRLEPHAQGRLSWSSSQADGNERTIRYREPGPDEKLRWRLEVLVTFDPDSHPPRVEVSTAEGVTAEPTERHVQLHKDLVTRLEAQYPGRVVYANIW